MAARASAPTAPKADSPPSRPARTSPSASKPAVPARPALGYDLTTANVEAPPEGFVEAASAMGVELEPAEIERLGAYLGCLLAANKSMNLTAITDAREAWTRHILDSLSLLAATADLPNGARVIDVGTGGGLPGLPLAIVAPTLRVTLLEATSKKAEFLRAVIARLSLTNTEVAEGRAEVLAHDRGERTGSGRVNARRESFDLVVARAVARLPVLLELCCGFAKVGGRMCFIKGQQAEAERGEAAYACHTLKVVHLDTVPTPTGVLVAFEKRAGTPRDYPRANGEPARVPLVDPTVRREERRAERERARPGTGLATAPGNAAEGQSEARGVKPDSRAASTRPKRPRSGGGPASAPKKQDLDRAKPKNRMALDRHGKAPKPRSR